MNQTQQRIVIGAGALVVLMLLFPPFEWRNANGITINLGFGFLFDPPTQGGSRPGSVNTPLLLAEWAGVVIVAAALWAAFSKQVAEKSTVPAFSAKTVRNTKIFLGVVAALVVVAFAQLLIRGMANTKPDWTQYSTEQDRETK